MSDFRPTNEKIAELLQQQTYDERVEMARLLTDQIVDIGDDLDADAVARILGNWAEAELEAAEETP